MIRITKPPAENLANTSTHREFENRGCGLRESPYLKCPSKQTKSYLHQRWALDWTWVGLDPVCYKFW